MGLFSRHTFDLLKAKRDVNSKINPQNINPESYSQAKLESEGSTISTIFKYAEERKPMKNTSDDDDKYSKPKQSHWLMRRIYILSWIREYDREKCIADLIAGITLGLTIIPQSIAYAALAGLSSEYGLYSAFIGSVIYVFFGTISQVSIGPTSLMSLLVLQFCADKPVQFVIVLAFLAGLVELLMGIFQLGFIVSFIPAPVTKAFTTGAAAIVILVQIKHLFGIKTKGTPSLMHLISNLSIPDAIIGISCLCILLFLRKLSTLKLQRINESTRRLKKLLWYISISRNFLVVFFCSLMAYVWVQENSYESVPFALSARVDSAAISVNWPPFAFDYNNGTYSFIDICRELGSGIIVVPIVAILANVAIAKAFIKDASLDASQEMLTLGLCNLAGSFFSAMPTCGAFTRSAVSQASGVRTPMAGIYTGILVLSSLGLLTPYFGYIPKPTLAAVLIAAVIFMIDLTPFKDLWVTNKKDFFSWLGCLIVCLVYGVEMGLFFGILLNMIFILLRLGNPTVEASLKDCNGLTYLHIMPTSDIYYSGVDHLRSKIRAACSMYRNDFPVVLDCSRFMLFDATFIDMINAVGKELQENNVLLVLHCLNLKAKNLIKETEYLHFSANDILSLEDLMITKKCGDDERV